tara:strand:- start:47 stop:412 length:366 start_codon:yes stop_codon:yes gene_type:complete
MNIFVGLMVIALTVPHQTAGRFDLVCVGTQKTTTTPARRWEDRIRVDLGANVYCWKNCTVRSEIYKVTEGQLIFENAAGVTTVNRVTGQFHCISPAPGEGYREIDGRCERAEFTPLTPRAF